MEEQFLQFIADKKLCSKSDRILLAVSGGMDSMVMLNLFHKFNFTMAVAHVNFQLRGNDSELDQKLVKEVSERNEIQFFETRFETQMFARENSLSIQMAARELRYNWFDELLHQTGFDFIATAHHLNDSIETALLNFVRGSGPEGWDGIACKNGKIIRPLLFATRKEIELYAVEKKIHWREDESNSTDHYQRNFIRHQVVPKLKEINPSLEHSFADALEKISGTNALSQLGQELFRSKFEVTKSDQVLFLKQRFTGTDSEGLLWNLIKKYRFNFDQCKQISKAIVGQSGKKFQSKEFELIVDREYLIISKTKSQSDQVLIEKDQRVAQRGEYILEIESLGKTAFSVENSAAFIDADELTFPLVWKAWQAGDSFYPLGMRHKKKVSDFLIDKKISLADKESVSVIQSGNDIIWIVGMRVDDRFKVTDKTKHVLLLRLAKSSS